MENQVRTNAMRKSSFRIDDILNDPATKINKAQELRREDEIHSFWSSPFRPYERVKADDEVFVDKKTYDDHLRKSAIIDGIPHYDYSKYYGHVPENLQWSLNNSNLMSYGRINTYPPLAYSPYYYHRPLSLSSFSKRKGGQVRFTPSQTQNLERRFGSHKYLSPEDRKLLAGQLKLSDRQVKTWFQNRRAKWRRTVNTSSSETEDVESERPESSSSSKSSFKNYCSTHNTSYTSH